MKLRRAWPPEPPYGYYVTAIWLGIALVAAVVSIRVAVPAALVEIVVGAPAGNIPRAARARHPAEIDPASLREHWRASLSIGLVSFGLPFGAGHGRDLVRVRADPDRAAVLPAAGGHAPQPGT